MIKNLFLGMAVGAALLTSCSSEDPAPVATDGNVTFTATLPGELMGRGYGDGTTATQLTYVVYNAAGEEIPMFTKNVDLVNLKATVSLNLVPNQEYTIVFWAQAPDAPYNLDTANGTVTVTPTGTSQAENRDAFFAAETFVVNGAASKTVELKRPFAQINIGTTDMAEFKASNGTISVAGLQVTAPDVLNLKDGTVSGEAKYILDNAAFPDEAFPMTLEGKTFTYLVADYILVGNTKETIDVTWTSDNSVADRQKLTYTGVPVQRNYRTNIYGSLLTDSYTFNVMITPDFTEPAHEYVVVQTPEAFVDAVTKGMNVEIPAALDVALDEPLSLHDGQEVIINGTLSSPKSILNIPAGATATIKGAGTLNFDFEGDGLAEGGRYAVNGIDVYGNLNLEDVTLVTDNHIGGSMIYVWDGAEATLDNVTVNTGFRALTTAPGAKITVNGGAYHSTSHNGYTDSTGKSAYAYAVVISGEGTEGEFNNVVITGIQGAFSVSKGSSAVLNNCDFSTYDPEGRPWLAFYAVYTAQGADVTINSGKYYSPRVAVYSGNNDIPGDTFGAMRIYGGYFSKKPAWSQQAQADYPLPTGYVWAANDDERYPWTVVKE